MERTWTSVLVGFLFVVIGGVASLGWSKWWNAQVLCDASWNKRIELANETWLQAVAEEAKKVVEADNALAKEQKEGEKLRRENQRLLALQRETLPLSDPCVACRVPWERLWLRKGSGTSAANPTSTIARGGRRVDGANPEVGLSTSGSE